MEFEIKKLAGGDAGDALVDYRAQYSKSGLYPFLIDKEDSARQLEWNISHDPRTPQQIIKESLDFNILRWMSAKEDELENKRDLLGNSVLPRKALTNLPTPFDLHAMNFRNFTYIGLVPCELPWHLPAHLKFGDWNYCPAAEIHCAFWRSWQEECGAQIIAFADDAIEATISKPAIDPRHAINLAWEHYWYCPDTVEQGVETVYALASALFGATKWYFWWD